MSQRPRRLGSGVKGTPHSKPQLQDRQHAWQLPPACRRSAQRFAFAVRSSPLQPAWVEALQRGYERGVEHRLQLKLGLLASSRHAAIACGTMAAANSDVVGLATACALPTHYSVRRKAAMCIQQKLLPLAVRSIDCCAH